MRVEDDLSFYLEYNLCTKHNDIKSQYISFHQAVMKVQKNKEKILSGLIDSNPEIKLFMIDHSCFDDEVHIDGDWLEKFMYYKLQMDEHEIRKIIEPRIPPDSLMEQFKVFNPVPIVFEKHPVRIEYGMWKRNEHGRVVDPINIIDTSWDNINIMTPAQVKEFLSEHDDINVPNDYEYTPLEEDDLPF